MEPPSVEYRYEVTALPPSERGAVHERFTRPSPGEAVKFCGADGVVSGTADTAGEDAGPVPTALAAVTVIVYSVPFTRSGIIIGPAASVNAERPPVLAGETLTV